MSSVMDRIREAAARAAAGPLSDARERPAFPSVAALSPFPPDAGTEEFISRFRTELESVAGFAHGPFDASGVAEKVIELVRAKAGDAETRGHGDTENPHPPFGRPLPEGEAYTDFPLPLGEGQGEGSAPPIRILSWAGDQLGCPGLEEALREAGIELVLGDVPNDSKHQSVLEGHATLDVGLSGAVAGLADTGSILVSSGPGRPRIASLLTPVHIAVLPVSRIYPTMQDWIADGGVDLARETANLVVITGSSRTSDIELQLTLGMHGPKELHIVLYRE